ncbi:hypothetical protein NDU88_007101 [Pleurodeles waltl]|uniref:Uncharacterized protein n=1 Tax=Pleurodeles waltl TaxID=8319 RepID=A0AAV7VNQ9_PLEWA|nr:hypothetical protein NDU88_007101 [Pleurodeles waltl]
MRGAGEAMCRHRSFGYRQCIGSEPHKVRGALGARRVVKATQEATASEEDLRTRRGEEAGRGLGPAAERSGPVGLCRPSPLQQSGDYLWTTQEVEEASSSRRPAVPEKTGVEIASETHPPRDQREERLVWDLDG